MSLLELLPPPAQHPNTAPQLDPQPDFIKSRLEIFDRLKAEHEEEIKGEWWLFRRWIFLRPPRGSRGLLFCMLEACLRLRTNLNQPHLTSCRHFHQSPCTTHPTAKERAPIQITLPDGSVKEGTSWETSPMTIALGISKGLAEKAVIAKVQ